MLGSFCRLYGGGTHSQPKQVPIGQGTVGLGYVVGKGVISVPQARAQAKGNYVKPNAKRGLRAFLGSVLLSKVHGRNG